MLRFERGSSPPNCFIHFFKLYVIVHLCTFRIAFELKIVDTSSYSNFDLFNGSLTIYADVRFEKVTRAARFIETITMFPFSKTKHVRWTLITFLWARTFLLDGCSIGIAKPRKYIFLRPPFLPIADLVITYKTIRPFPLPFFFPRAEFTLVHQANNPRTVNTRSSKIDKWISRGLRLRESPPFVVYLSKIESSSSKSWVKKKKERVFFPSRQCKSSVKVEYIYGIE